LLWRHLTPHRKNCNIGAQLQSLRCITAPKKFRKIYSLNDFCGAQTCSFRAVFGLLARSLTIYYCCQRYITSCGKIYRCKSTFSALNYCSGIFFKFLSYLYEVVRTNFSADFLDFSQFLTAISRKLSPLLATKMSTM